MDYYNDINLKDLDDIDLKKTSGKQITARKIVKKCRNLASKKPYQRISKKTDDVFEFLKQVPLIPGIDWLEKQKTRLNF